MIQMTTLEKLGSQDSIRALVPIIPTTQTSENMVKVLVVLSRKTSSQLVICNQLHDSKNQFKFRRLFIHNHQHKCLVTKILNMSPCHYHQSSRALHPMPRSTKIIAMKLKDTICSSLIRTPDKAVAQQPVNKVKANVWQLPSHFPRIFRTSLQCPSQAASSTTTLK